MIKVVGIPAATPLVFPETRVVKPGTFGVGVVIHRHYRTRTCSVALYRIFFTCIINPLIITYIHTGLHYQSVLFSKRVQCLAYLPFHMGQLGIPGLNNFDLLTLAQRCRLHNMDDRQHHGKHAYSLEWIFHLFILSEICKVKVKAFRQ